MLSYYYPVITNCFIIKNKTFYFYWSPARGHKIYIKKKGQQLTYLLISTFLSGRNLHSRVFVFFCFALSVFTIPTRQRARARDVKSYHVNFRDVQYTRVSSNTSCTLAVVAHLSRDRDDVIGKLDLISDEI